MKKIMYAMMVAVLALALTACGNNEEGKDKQKDAGSQKKDEKAAQMKDMQKKMEKQQVKDDKVVATVNDKKIKGVDYNRALTQYQMQYQQMGQDPTSDKVASQLKDQVIKSLVDYEVVLQEAEDKGYKASDDAVNKQFDQIKGQYKEKKKFDEALKMNNMSEDDLKQQIAKNIQYTNYVDKEIAVDDVSEQQLKDYYNKMKKAQGDKAPEYEKVKEQIKKQLVNQQKQQKVTEKVKELKKDDEIKIKI